MAAAASVAIILLLWPDRNDFGERLAQLEQQVETEPSEVLDRIGKLIDEPLSDATRNQATSLAERAGYLVARDYLTGGEFSGVSETEARVKQLGASSARLTNLRLRAEQGATTESALAGADALTDYGYQLNGRNPTKSLGNPKSIDMDQTQARWERDLNTAIEQFPRDRQLQLNLGHLLLSQGRLKEAIDVFRQALALDQNNASARIALGLALYEWGEHEEALVHFQAAAERDGDNFVAQLNTGIVLERLGRKSDARPYFERAQDLAASAEEQSRILQHLQSGDD